MSSPSGADAPTSDESRLARLHRHALDRRVVSSAGEPSRAEVVERLAPLVAAEEPLLPDGRVRELADRLAARITGLGALEPLLRDPTVTEVMVNGPGRVWVERRGRVTRVAVDFDHDDIERVIERVLTPLGLRCDRSSPVVDARLPDGSRFHAVVPPVAVDGPYVTLRRFGARPLPLEAFAGDECLHALLGWAMRSGWNLLVSGGTSSGKTTLLNALSARIAPGERVVTIEETAELRLRLEHSVRLEARPANAEGAGEVTLDDLVRAALRMRPDRLVVGEVRGPEALYLLDALNTGHDGSLSTIHANSPVEALHRLGSLALRGSTGVGEKHLRAQVRRSIDAVVHVERSTGGARRIEQVAEVGAAGGADDAADAVRLLWCRGSGLVGRPGRPSRRLPTTPFALGSNLPAQRSSSPRPPSRDRDPAA